MQLKLLFLLCAGLLVGSASGATIGFEVTPLGGNNFRYNYFVSGITFQMNEELDIKFDPNLYGTLSNAVAGPGFNVILLQPNNPQGVAGDYSAVATMNNPPLTGPFSVDFVFLGTGQPGGQPFFINQLDQTGHVISTLDSGTTVLVPEVSSISLAAAGFLAIGLLWHIRRVGQGLPCAEL